jgi:hypothetical protein
MCHAGSNENVMGEPFSDAGCIGYDILDAGLIAYDHPSTVLLKHMGNSAD